jgi:cold shock CspA family protein
MNDNLTRIAVFYDGNFFFKVSNYYHYTHERKARIDVAGLHDFIKAEIARLEKIDPKLCQIVDAHYFRGRLSAKEADEREKLYGERVFDEVLMRHGITAHYLPLGPNGEKGIDVWLALEAFELAIYKRFDVLVLIACDSDFVPLVRKLNTLGTRVMLLGWDFKFVDDTGREQETRTSQLLLNEVTYPVEMNAKIDARTSGNTSNIIDCIFFAPKNPVRKPISSPKKKTGKIFSLKTGYGFIVPDEGGENIFFHHCELLDIDFNDLEVKQVVQYTLNQNGKGLCAENITTK